MCSGKDIVLVVDYHDNNLSVRRFDEATGEEQVLTVPTAAETIQRLVADAVAELPAGGRVVWVMESTTGWARVRDLIGEQVRFGLANVLQMPRPPKARRRKTDKVDTKRLLREYLAGTLPWAYQPDRMMREARRLVACRESLVSRRTAVRNWLDRYLAHETWASRSGLWSQRGQARLRRFAASLNEIDRTVWEVKLDELAQIEGFLGRVEAVILRVYDAWPAARRLDAILGIAENSAVSILARIGSVDRFDGPEQLIAFAGLAPGVQQSDQTVRNGRVGGAGTDKHLRHYLIEATLWARKIPRYRKTYERIARRRGKKVGRLVVARMLVRSIYKMLRDGVAFEADVA